MKPSYATELVPNLSGHAIANRWRSLPRVRRHRATKPQGSSERVLPCLAGPHGPINMCLSFPVIIGRMQRQTDAQGIIRKNKK